MLGAGPGWRITHTVFIYCDSQHQSATNPGTWVHVERQSSWAQVRRPLGKSPGYPGCRSERKVNQGSTEHIHDDAGQTGSVPPTSATRCPRAAVNSLAALSTACLSRISYPAGEGWPTSARHLAFPKIRVGQVRFPFKRDGLPSTHLFIQQKTCFGPGTWSTRKRVSREQDRQDSVLTGLYSSGGDRP